MAKHHSKLGSSSIDTCSHDDEKNILTIRFTSGQTYHYHDCPKHHYDAIIGAKSAGGYLHKNVLGKFKHEKADE